MPAAKSKTITEPEENKAELNESRPVSDSDDKPKTIGEFFQSIRVQKKLDIKTIAETLNISPRFIRAIEMMDINQLPEKVYTLGFVRSYSKYLEIDPQKSVNTFRTQFYNDKSGPHDYKVGHLDSSTLPSRKIIIVSLVVFSIVGLSWLVFDYSHQSSLPFDSGINLPEKSLSRNTDRAIINDTSRLMTEEPFKPSAINSGPNVTQSKNNQAEDDQAVELQVNTPASVPSTKLDAKVVTLKASEAKPNGRPMQELGTTPILRGDNQTNNIVPVRNKTSVHVTTENFDIPGDDAPAGSPIDTLAQSPDHSLYGPQPNAD